VGTVAPVPAPPSVPPSAASGVPGAPAAPLDPAEFFRLIPKVELHCHLFGSVRKRTFEELAAKARAPITQTEIDAFYTRGPKPVGVLHVLRTLDQHLMLDGDAFYRITLEYLEDAARENVRHAEFFWNPTGTVNVSRVPYPVAAGAMVRAIRDAERAFGITGRLIASIDRQAEPSAAVEMVDLVAAHPFDEVIGIGIDYREVDRPPELFAEAYVRARRAGLRRTAHAGEFGMPWTNVRTAIDVLGVERIDHGYTVVDRPDFAARCAESGMVFTVIPTNSYYLRTLPPERWALDHPIRAMPGLGLRIHPNTDDPTLHHVTPGRAWHMMCSDFGFSLDDIASFMAHGIDAAWVEESVKRGWRRDWTAEFAALRALLAGGV
jgi:adenosine deaminase